MPSRATLPPFVAVLEEHGPAVLRFCRSQAGADRGEDVFQETMLAALRAYETIREPAAVRSWLFAIAARQSVDAHRRAARAPTPVAEPGIAEAAAAAAPGEEGGDGGDGELWRQVARLPEKQRQAVGLRFLADLPHREIAAAMGISEAAARRNVFEGLNRLRRELA